MANNYSDGSEILNLLLVGIAGEMKNRGALGVQHHDLRPVIKYPFSSLYSGSNQLMSAHVEEDKQPHVLRLTMGSSLTREEINIIRNKSREFCTEHGYAMA